MTNQLDNELHYQSSPDTQIYKLNRNNNQINYLEFTISRNINKETYTIYRKPMKLNHNIQHL